MAESTQGRIVIDAQGTEKNVLEPKPIVSENPFKEKAEAAAAGLGAALIVEAAETIGEKIKQAKIKKTESKRDTEEETKSYNFGQVETKLMSGKLNKEEEKFFQTVRERQIEEFKDVDNGDFVRDTRIAVTRILKNNDWDDIYDELTHYGETREGEMRGRSEIDDRLNGISMAAVRYEASRVLVAGLANKRQEVGQKDFLKWIKEEKSDQYSKEEIETLQKLAKRSFVRLAPDAPEELVGRNIKKEESFTRDPEQINPGESIKGYLDRLNQNIEELFGSMQGVSPRVERERWSDVEHSQQFYARFSPNVEPKFYQQLTPEKRREFDARWQLARAAYVKRATAGSPDKYRENQELEMLGREQMEILYKIPGVRELLQGYAQAITNKKTFEVDGKQMSFWEIRSADDFSKFRESMRNEILNRPNLFNNTNEVRSSGDESQKTWWVELLKKEADAIAWNWIWVGNLTESADSRYSYSGKPTFGIPSAVSAGEYKYALHPQERFEGKSFMQHFWGAFGKWGVTQMQRIKNESGYSGKDDIKFLPAKRNEYWRWKLAEGEKPTDEKKAAQGGRVFNVYAPECYPTTSCKSFWEESEITVSKNNRTSKRSLLEFLRNNEIIPWEEVPQDAWAIYMYGKFHKAYQLLQVFNPEKPIDIRKPGWALDWANSTLELFVRLDPKQTLEELTKTKKTYQTYHNLKVWAVHAAFGGVSNINNNEPSLSLGFQDKIVVQGALNSQRNKYLQNEKLNIE